MRLQNKVAIVTGAGSVLSTAAAARLNFARRAKLASDETRARMELR
jgi:NAD(P)-dependent dehydrogenase (short-subunit alcohol dehydrogenase family)